MFEVLDTCTCDRYTLIKKTALVEKMLFFTN